MPAADPSRADVAERLKRVEDELARTRAHYFEALSNLVETAVVLDREWRCLYLNAAAERRLGLPSAQLAGCRLTDVWPDAADHPAFPFVQRCMRDRVTRREGFDASFPDGHGGRFELTCTPSPDGLLVTQSEAALAEPRPGRMVDEAGIGEPAGLAASVINSSPDILYLYDVEETRNVYANAGLTKVLGYTDVEVKRMGRDLIQTLMHPDDFAHYLEVTVPRYARAADGEPIEHQYRLRHRDGTWRWIDCTEHIYSRSASRAPKIIFGVARDYTARKRIEQRLVESEAKLQEAQQMAGLGYWRWDLRDGEIEWSDEVYKTFGLDTGTFQPTLSAFADLFPWGEEVVEGLKGAARSHGPARIGTYEHRFDRPDGSVGYYLSTFRGVFDAEDRLSELRGTIQDITAQKHAAQELQTLSSAVKQSSEGIVISDLEGRVVFANLAWCRMHGGERPDELVGRELRSFHSKAHYERVVGPLTRRAIEAGSSRGEVEHSTRTGERFPALTTTSLIRDEDGEPTALVRLATDIGERRRLEDDLRASRAFRTRIIEDSPFPLWIADPTGLVVETNRALREATGAEEGSAPEYNVLEDEALVRLGVMPSVAAVFRDHTPARFEAAWAGWRADASSGHEPAPRTVDASLFAIVDADGALLNVVCQWVDISDRVRAAATVTESESRYRSLFENMNTGFVLFEAVLDEAGTPVDLVIVAANRGFESTTGLVPDEVIGERLTHVLPGIEDDAARWIDTYGQIALSGQSRQFEQGSELLGYHYSVSAFRPAPNQCAVTFLDVSERKRAEKERERLQTAIEQTSEMVIVTDPDGTIQYVNSAFEMTTGYTRAEALGANLRSLSASKPARTRIEELWAKVSSGHDWKGRTSSQRKDGTSYVEEATYSPVLDGEGRLRSVAIVKRDVTEQVRLSEEKAHLEAHLLQQQKLEAIGTLASGVAHEINNPITGVINYAQLIADELPRGSVSATYAEEIIAETQRVATIVKNLLAFSRQDKMSHSPAHISDIVESTLSLIRTIIRRDQIALEVEVEPDLPKVKCRSQQIQQVLMNLLTNARDALNERFPGHDDRKTMRISAFGFREDGRRWVRISVADGGVGIPEDVERRIFEPFFSTKARDKGTGLGLSISHGIVSDHHGRMTVDSEAGEGTTVHVDLPVDNGWTLE